MTPSNRLEFLSWFEKQKDKLFGLQLKDYCISDVDILAKSCLTYRDIFLDVTRSEHIENDIGDKSDPFQHCFTIASVCNLVYRRNFMKTKTIALIPEYGLNLGQNHSHKQLLWLKYISIKDNVYIKHCKKVEKKKLELIFWMVSMFKQILATNFTDVCFMDALNVINQQHLIR